MPDANKLLGLLDSLAIHYEAINAESVYLAGSVFRDYRQKGGPREHIIPDFLIAAHAQWQCSRLAAIDHGYLSVYFPDLKLL